MSKGLTLGQFRKLTAHLHPETEIVLDDENGDWYSDVEAVALPEKNFNGYVAITLFRGEKWDNLFPADEPAELWDSNPPAPKDSEPVL